MVAVAAAMLVGGTGGYVVRAVTSHVSAPATSGVNRAAPADEDITQSDLTRAQPAAAAVPDWVQRYTAKAPASQFKVDQFIEGLGYAQAAATENGRPLRGGPQTGPEA